MLKCRLSESTLKRHVYHCRSRRAPQQSRSRSCITCAKAKTRCDGARPHCSRCVSKNHVCRYANITSETRQAKDMQITSVSPEMRAFVGSSALRTSTQPSIENNLLLQDLDLESIGMWSPTWTSPDIEPSGWGEPFLLQNNLPAMPTLLTRSFVRRTMADPGSQRTADLMLHTLRSQLFEMLHDGALPSFVHVTLKAEHATNDETEALTNCISLVHMISSRKGSRKLFWKNVRMECDRVCAECQTLSRNELFAAMQAVFIYVLVRLDEGETEHNNLDVLLFNTVTILTSRLSTLDWPTMLHPTGEASKVPAWKDWVLEESRRRLSILCRILNMLVYFDPVGLCNLPKDLLLAPLPAQKQLWEAPEADLWLTQAQSLAGSAYALARNGALVKLSNSSLTLDHKTFHFEQELLGADGNRRDAATWDEWLTNVDHGFDGLVMLAASMAS